MSHSPGAKPVFLSRFTKSASLLCTFAADQIEPSATHLLAGIFVLTPWGSVELLQHEPACTSLPWYAELGKGRVASGVKYDGGPSSESSADRAEGKPDWPGPAEQPGSNCQVYGRCKRLTVWSLLPLLLSPWSCSLVAAAFFCDLLAV